MFRVSLSAIDFAREKKLRIYEDWNSVKFEDSRDVYDLC